MAQKKSAAKLKVVDAKAELTEEQMVEQLQKILDDAKLAIDKSISIQIDQTMRFDSLLAIHDSFIRFGFEECHINHARSVALRMKYVLADIQAVIADLSLDAMAAKEYTNPIDRFVPETAHGRIGVQRHPPVGREPGQRPPAADHQGVRDRLLQGGRVAWSSTSTRCTTGTATR